MLAISTNLILAPRNALRHGFWAIWPLALISSKIGVSCSCRRMKIAIATSKKDTRNGIRQPQSLNASVPRYARVPDNHEHRHHDPASAKSRCQPVEAAALVRNMLGDVGDGAAVFPAQAQTLDHAQGEEEKRGCDADRLEGGTQADHPRAQPYTGQGDQERVLASYPIAQPAKEERPQRTDQEASREQRNRAQQSRHRMGLFEELDRQDRSQACLKMW